MSEGQPLHVRSHRRVRAFGLVELMVVVAILAILAAIALPSYRQSIQNNRAGTQGDDLVTAINTARTEAVTRSRFVTICAANGAVCANSTNWVGGWIVFTDDYPADPASPTPPGNIGVIDGENTVLRAWPALDQTSITTTATYIAFDRFGRPRTAAGPITTAQTIVVKPQGCTTGHLKRTVSVSPIGRAIVTVGDCP